jgi:hypothetical protein
LKEPEKMEVEESKEKEEKPVKDETKQEEKYDPY